MPGPIRLGRAFATVGGLTMASRVLGFVRDMMIAAFLGSGPVAEAFFVAFRLPNMFRRFFAEGAFNMAFVPLFAKRLEGDGREEARRFAEEALAGLTFILLILSAGALVAMPLLIMIISPGFADNQEKFDLAVLYGRIEFPYLLCMSLTALFSGVLNAMGRFAAPAAAPILLNIVLIGFMALAIAIAAPVGHALAWGVFAAGIAQVALVAWAARRAGMGLRLRRPAWTPGMRRLVSLGIPGMISGGALQINLLIGTIIASFYSGAVAWLNFADRIYQLPLGVVGVAIGVVLLPDLSRKVRAGDGAGARASLNRAAEFAMALTLPAAAGLLVLPFAISALLYQRGVFLAEDAEAVGAAVAIFAVGLPAFVLQKVFAPVFFAREDMQSPLRYAVISMVVNTLISLSGLPVFGLFGELGWLTIPIGTSLSSWLHVTLLMRGARIYGDEARIDDRMRRRGPRLVLSAAIMGLVVLAGSMALAPLTSGAGAMVLTLALIGGGAALYFGTAQILGALNVREIIAAGRKV